MEPAKIYEYCLFGINHWSVCMTKSEWASTVQAICSLVALAAGLLYVNHQFRLSRRASGIDQRDEERSDTTYVLDLVAEFRGLFSELHAHLLGTAGMSKARLDDLEPAVQELSKIDEVALSTAVARASVKKARVLVPRIRERKAEIERIKAGGMVPGGSAAAAMSNSLGQLLLDVDALAALEVNLKDWLTKNPQLT